MEAAEEVEVQLERLSLLVRVAAEVEVQSGEGGGLAMRVAIEVEVQLGSGNSIVEAAVVVGMEGAVSRGGKSHTIKSVEILVESIVSVHITFHRLRVFQSVSSDGPHAPPHLLGVIVLQLSLCLFLVLHLSSK